MNVGTCPECGKKAEIVTRGRVTIYNHGTYHHAKENRTP